MDSTTLSTNSSGAADSVAGELGSPDSSIAMGGPAITAASAAVEAETSLESAEPEPTDPQTEDAYWRDHYRDRPYYRHGRFYFDYKPGYRYGWESAFDRKYRDKSFDKAEADLAAEWAKAGTGLPWREWREIVRDAWNHVRNEA